tara:strand:+ start:208 stop:606 length:399 start_codon:yes stop_codon:yes gene_type:complete
MEYLLYFLIFIFGIATHKTFFVYRSAYASLFIIRMAQKTSLSMIVRALENYSYAKTFCIQQMNKNGASEKEIENFKIYIENDIELLKQSSIKEMNKILPNYFNSAEIFHDWQSAMVFLESYQQLKTKQEKTL